MIFLIVRATLRHMSSHFFESISCSCKGGYQEVVRMHGLFENMCCVHRERTVALLAKISHQSLGIVPLDGSIQTELYCWDASATTSTWCITKRSQGPPSEQASEVGVTRDGYADETDVLEVCKNTTQGLSIGLAREARRVSFDNRSHCTVAHKLRNERSDNTSKAEGRCSDFRYWQST